MANINVTTEQNEIRVFVGENTGLTLAKAAEASASATTAANAADRSEAARDVSIASSVQYTTEAAAVAALADGAFGSYLDANGNPVWGQRDGASMVALPGPWIDADKIGFTPSGTGAVARTVQNVLRDTVSAKDFGAVGDGVADDTAAIQAAIDYVSTNSLGALYVPAGNYSGNWTIKSDCVIEGDGRNSTVFTGRTNAPTFTVSDTVATVRFGWRDCRITGNAANANNIGLNIKPVASGTWCDHILIEAVHILDCGSTGLYAYGTSTSGPFVQNLRMHNVFMRGNAGRGFHLDGTVIETTMHGIHCVNNADALGTIPNAEISIDSGGSGAAGGRVGMYDCLFNHNVAMSAGNDGTALKLNGARTVNILSCDFEQSNPMIDIVGTINRNIRIVGNRFSSTYDADQYIKIQDATGLEIDFNDFGGAGTVNRFIEHTTSYTRANRVRIGPNNTFSLSSTLDPTRLTVLNTLPTASTLYLHNDYQEVSKSSLTIVRDIFDYSATGRENFAQDQICSIKNVGTAPIRFKHGTGNIDFKSGVDLDLVPGDIIHLKWNAGSWKEHARRFEPVALELVCSDESTAIGSTGTKHTFRTPYAMTLQEVRASLTTACTTGTFTVDVNEAGATSLSTKLTIDATEKTSETAAAAHVVNTNNEWPADAEVTIDVDDIGDGNATGLKVKLIGVRTG